MSARYAGVLLFIISVAQKEHSDGLTYLDAEKRNMAGVTLEGPVGIRFKKQNVRNLSRDQAKVINLLKQIPPSDGGKQGVWTGVLMAGPDGTCPNFLASAIWDFQQHWKAKGVFRHIDGVVDPGMNTLKKLNELTPGSGGLVTPPTELFVCGPNVTQQIMRTWTTIELDFERLNPLQKLRACNAILLPFSFEKDDIGIPTNLEELKKKVQSFADINGWDTRPLFQGESEWLRKPPVYDPALNGPCATPSSKGDPADPFDPLHEDPATCSNTVQVAGRCWLNGSVNYGTFGIMVRKCSQFARTVPFNMSPALRAVYSLTWAETLIRAYKKFGANPEGAVVPIAWTRATFNAGPAGVPNMPGNRPKCNCTCGCSGDVVTWDYVWKPHKALNRGR